MDLTQPSTLPNLNEFIFNLLQRVRRSVSMIHRSSVLDAYVRNEIHLKNQETDHNSSLTNVKPSTYNDPVIDFIIRWSSTYKMLTRFIKVRSIMNDITHTPYQIEGLKTKQRLKLSKLAFSHSDWTWLISLEYVLQPFAQSTQLLSGRTYQTIAIGKIVMSGLKHFLTTRKSDELIINYLKEQLLNKYEEHCEENISKDVEEAMMVSISVYEKTISLFIFLDFIVFESNNVLLLKSR